MVRIMREYLQGRGFRIILWALLFCFVLTSAIPLFLKNRSRDGAGVVATVNGIDITTQEYIKRVKQEEDRLSFFRQQFGKQADSYLAMFGISANPEISALDSLEKEKILDSIARDIHLEISPDYILNQLHDKNYLARELGGSFVDSLGRIDMQRLTYYLKQQGLSITDFEQHIEDQLRRRLVVALAGSAVHVPAYKVRHEYIRKHGARSYSILFFSRSEFEKMAKATAVTDKELGDFFTAENQQSKRYVVPEKRSGFFWTFTPATYGIEVSEAEIENNFNKNKKNYIQKAETVTVRKALFSATETQKPEMRLKAEEYRKNAIENPTSFSKNEIVSFERGALSDAVVGRAALSLKQDGDFSPVIETKDGFVILQRVSHAPVTYKPLSSVSDAIKTTLMQNKFNRQFPLDVRRALSEGTVQEFIDQKRGMRTTVTDQTKTTDGALGKMFLLDKGSYGSLADKNQGFVVNVTEIVKAHVPELATLKETVRKDYYEHKAQKAMQDALFAVQQEIIAHPDNKAVLQEAAKQPGAHSMTTPVITPDQMNLKEFEEKGIATDVLADLTVPGSSRFGLSPQGAYLAQLLTIADIDEDDFQAQRTAGQAAVFAQMESLIQGAFVASLTKNATINMNEPVRRLRKNL